MPFDPDQYLAAGQGGGFNPDAYLAAPHPNDNGAHWNGTDNFSSGVLQGMGDEVKALAQATKAQFTGGPSFGNAYDQAKTMYQGAREKYSQENPKTAMATNIAGQAAPWLLAAPAMAAGGGAVSAALGDAVPKLAPALEWLGGSTRTARTLAGSLQGAGMGASSGFTNAEGDIGDRLNGAEHGGMVGALLGGAAPSVVDMVSAGGRGAYNQIAGRLPFGQENVAQRKIAEALAREGMTPDQAMARMQEIGPNAALLDVGANPRALASAVYQRPGEGKQMVGDFLTARQEGTRAADGTLQGGQINRITSGLNDLVPEDFHATQEGINSNNAASQFYKEAYAANKDVASPTINRILDTPLGADALSYARERMQNRMSLMATPDADLTEQMRLLADVGKMDRVPGGVSKGLKLETLDLVKQGMDDSISAMQKRVAQGNARQGELNDLRNLKNGFIGELDKLDVTASAGPNSLKPEGGAYAQARKLASAKFGNRDALEAGSNFMNKSEFQNPHELAQSLAEMSPEELHNFRIGSAQALKQKLGDMNTRTDATKKLMDVPALEQKIQQAFGDPQTFQRYIGMLQNERTMFDSYAAAKGNSLTAERTAALEDAKVDPSRVMQGLQRMASTHPTDWIGGAIQALGGVKDRIMLPEGVSREMARVLVGQDVTPLRRAAQAQQLNESARRRMALALTAAGSPGHGQ